MKNNLQNMHKVNTCQDCVHYYETHEYDEGLTGEFCTKGNKSEIPRCGSVQMNESFWDWETYVGEDGKTYTTTKELTDKEFHKRYKRWENWAKRNGIPKNHICDDFEINIKNYN